MPAITDIATNNSKGQWMYEYYYWYWYNCNLFSEPLGLLAAHGVTIIAVFFAVVSWLANPLHLYIRSTPIIKVTLIPLGLAQR